MGLNPHRHVVLIPRMTHGRFVGGSEREGPRLWGPSQVRSVGARRPALLAMVRA